MARSKKTAVEPASDAGLPVEAPALVDVVPSAPVASAAPLLRRWRVQIPWVPPMEVEAASEEEAIAAYNGMMSILRTDHKHTVTPLD